MSDIQLLCDLVTIENLKEAGVTSQPIRVVKRLKRWMPDNPRNLPVAAGRGNYHSVHPIQNLDFETCTIEEFVEACTGGPDGQIRLTDKIPDFGTNTLEKLNQLLKYNGHSEVI